MSNSIRILEIPIIVHIMTIWVFEGKEDDPFFNINTTILKSKTVGLKFSFDQDCNVL